MKKSGLSETSGGNIETNPELLQLEFLAAYLPVNGLRPSEETENGADYFDDGPHLAEAGPDVGEGVTAGSLSTVS